MQKGGFWSYFFGGFVFFLCVFVLVFCKKAQKGHFLQFWRFSNFVPPKGLSLKSFFSSYSVFFFGFPFCLPFKMPLFSFRFFVHQPFFRKHSWFWFLLFLCFLAFPFLMFACFIETIFPNIPFFKPRLLSFLAGYFLCCRLFLFSRCMFLPFCFYVGFVFGNVLVVCRVSLFCFQSMKKTQFSFQFLCFLKLSWLNV